ncbi:hypothetical protein R5W24_003471 [Gemmata sp. JC717]|uniref:hypothetical protein n=1 Tax=Gemmata algarum TaxID=2975278 RepID=UPI0021BA9E7C|nr:hypothetical protein [Gemmata algarum]MDY3554351.1 hypothetical protein [Gemmata algarum]
MTFAAAALLGLTMGQPIGQDYHAMASRSIKLPIQYEKDPSTIRHVFLYVARNGENTWRQEASVTPDKKWFIYTAKEDGLYWFKMQIVDMKGNADPANLTVDPPDLKMVVDTTKPVIRVTDARRTGDEIVVQWAVDDKFPNDEATRVQFRATNGPENAWQDVTLPAGPRTGVRFPSGISEGVTVKISTADVAGNRGEVIRDFPAGNANANTTTALSSPAPTPVNTAAPLAGAGGAAVSPPAMEALATNPNPLPVNPTPLGPVAPTTPAPIQPQPHTPLGPLATSPSAGVLPTNSAPPNIGSGQPPQLQPGVGALPTQPQPGAATFPVQTPPSAPLVSSQPAAEGPKPLAVVDPKAVPPAPAPGATTQQAAAWSGASPTVEVTRAQVISYPRFDLGFDLESRGPSGLSRVDLWVTRDEGRNWRKWSQHDNKEAKGGSVRVSLDAAENPQLEGNYGFRLVPVSGAGLSEREPAPGDAPDMRVVLDVTPPQIDLFPPQSDPNALDTLVIQWRATDKNFGDDPITLEWSDAATGPWKPVAGAAADLPVVRATAMDAPAPKRLANTGQYSWRVPAGVPARVYLKATARDAAGNVKEVVTREPILVDLTKPRAKINGIVPPVSPRP